MSDLTNEKVIEILGEMNRKIDVLKESVDANTASTMEIEATLKAYGDMYKINGDHIQRLSKRVTKVEKGLDINPPEELLIPS